MYNNGNDNSLQYIFEQKKNKILPRCMVQKLTAVNKFFKHNKQEMQFEMQFDLQSQFDPLCRNWVLLYVSCTIWVEYKVSVIYFAANCFLLFSHKSSDWCTLAPPSIHILLITALYNPLTLCLPSMITYTYWWRVYGEGINSSPCTYLCLLPIHKGITGLVASPPDEEGDGYVRGL